MEQTIIDTRSTSSLPDIRELYRYRQLLYSLAWRDVRVKYAQTFIGFLWALINPIASMLILVFVFKDIAKVGTQNIPAMVFTIAGLVVWNYFSVLFSEAGNSIVGAQNMVKKIYFPRLVIPLSKAISGLIDLGVTLVCLVVLMLIYQVPLSYNVVYVPLFIFVAILCGWTGGIWMSALTVRYRDFKFIIPFMTRLGMFLSPVAYSASDVPERYALLYHLNPLTGAIEGFRWAVFGVGTLDKYVYLSMLILVVLFVLGILFFTQVERKMADIL